MNAIKLLIQDHNKVRHILAEISNNDHSYKVKRKIFTELCNDLLIHEKMEEEIWYPNFKHKLDDTVKHLVSEEKHAERVILEIQQIKDEKLWEEKFKKFKKEVEHHAKEEETKLFPQVANILSEPQLETLGAHMKKFKEDYIN
jgi:hemerythrin superfamily protein